jgi:opacity protein-like surface antigen
MRSLKFVLITTTALTASVASAADLSGVPLGGAPINTTPTWTGAYFGAYFGGGSGSADQSVSQAGVQNQTITTGANVQTFSSLASAAGSASGSTRGSSVDLFAGYNWQVGPQWLVGVQAEGAISDIKTTTSGATSGPTSDVSRINGVTVSSITGVSTQAFADTIELTSSLNLLGRAGFLITPNTLLYGIGGVSFGNFSSADKWETGYTAGGGVEQRVNANWLVRLEYRYAHFTLDRDVTASASSTSTAGASTSALTTSVTQNISTDFDVHMGKVGVIYQFGL